MDFGTFFGFFALGFGLFTLIARHQDPTRFAKLKIMQEKLGDKYGYILHVVAYSVLPILVGVSILLRRFVLGGF